MISGLSEVIIEASKIYESATFVGDYEDIRELLAALINDGDYNIIAIELEPEGYDGYDKEYSLSIYDNEELYVKKCYKFGKYLYDESDVTFIREELMDNDDLMEHICCDDLVVIPSEADYNECDGCEFCCECSDYLECDEDDEMPGFTFSKSDDKSHTTYSFYSSDRDLVDDMAEYVKRIFS